MKKLFSFLSSFLILGLSFYLIAENKPQQPDATKTRKPTQPIKHRLIVLSIDGYPGYYAEKDSRMYGLTPNLNQLREKSLFSNRVRSVYPTLTYPAHTSMITGLEPNHHHIRANRPFDPFSKISPGAWHWFYEDIAIKTVWEFAEEQGYRVGSVYWPVSLGATTSYNIPQYWRYKTSDDVKLLRALSTRGLYAEIEKDANVQVAEHTGDTEKMRAAISLWKLKKPDILFIYTTDLDTVHHLYGTYSRAAKNKLKTIDSLLGELIQATNLYNDPGLGLIVVSDHGFRKFSNICYPNKALIQMGHISPYKKKWNYMFRSHGGVATLLKNTGNDTLSNKKLDLAYLKRKMARSCPKAQFTSKGRLFRRIQKRLDHSALAAMIAKKDFIFSRSVNSTYSWIKLKGTGHHHGFLPSDEQMHTIGLVYPKRRLRTMRKITDVFLYTCHWMRLKCQRGIRKNRP